MTTCPVRPGLALDPSSPSFAADPFPVYAAVTAAGGVAPATLPNGSTAWLVTAYEPAREVLREVSRFSANPARAARPSTPGVLERHMLNTDGTEHLRLRAAVAARFTAPAIAALRPRVQAISGQLIEDVRRQLSTGPVELVSAYAFALPTLVVFDLLGVPLDDRFRLRTLTATVATPRAALPQQGLLDGAWQDLEAYFRELVRERRGRPAAVEPGRPPGLVDDLLSGPQAALSDDELLAMCFLLLFAGYETTMNLLGSIAWLLLGGRLPLTGAAAPDAGEREVEECLRWASPIEGATWRYAVTDTQLGTMHIPAGASVLVVLAAANRDEQRWPAAAVVDPSRPLQPHLAFGYGAHHCLGARLARLEAEIGLADLRTLLQDVRPAEPLQDLPWRTGLLVRGPARLLVTR
ncbi:MAG: cytochrome P450 [Actinomycetota bacterium]|nr:cytochrome P450 [Actinomycetota bacterium]